MAYGRFYEEFTVGEVIKHWPGRTITEADNTWFALLTMNQHPLHSDAHYAEQHTRHRQRVVLGPLVFSIGIVHVETWATNQRGERVLTFRRKVLVPKKSQATREQTLPSPDVEEIERTEVAPPWMTILHNCECHTFEQVVQQLQKAIACTEAEGWELAWQVHNTGKAVVKIAPEAECVRVGNILAAIGLVVTVVQS